MKFFSTTLVFVILLFLFHNSAISHVDKDSSSIVRHIENLTTKYYQSVNRNPKSSLRYSEEAYLYIDKNLPDETKFQIASNYATALYLNEEYPKALSILDQSAGLLIADKHQGLYHTLRGLVETELNQQLKAEEDYKTALEYYRKTSDKDNEFTVLNNLGILYNNVGDYKLSLASYLACYEIVNDLKIKVDRYKYYINIGTVNFNLNDFPKALSYYKSALNESIIQADTLRTLNSETKIAQTYVEIGQLDTALFYYGKAIQGYEKLDLNRDVCNILLRLGDIFQKQARNDKVLSLYEEAYQLGAANSYFQVIMESSFNIGSFYQKELNYNKAVEYFNHIIKTQKKNTNKELLKDTYFNLYRIEKQRRNTALALTYLEKYLAYDSVIKENLLTSQKEQIEVHFKLRQNELELENLSVNLALNKLSLESKQQQFSWLIIVSVCIIFGSILILWLYIQNRKSQKLLSLQNERINFQNQRLSLNNNEIKEQKKELNGLNKIKDQLLSIIAHDVKSPITDLNNLLSILRNHVNMLSKIELQENLAMIESNTTNLLHFLNNILNWVVSQSAGIQVKLTQISLNNIIKANIELIQNAISAKKLNIVFNPAVSPNLLKSDSNIVDFALRNVLSNAVKYSQAQGDIHIEIEDHQNTVQIRIADKGIGISEKICTLLKQNSERLPSLSGTNKEEGYGIGLSLCKKMLAKIDSKIHYNKNVPAGSVFTIELKRY
nr:tetratricopeptide repeat-containing sensor histidine kinase [uncultured Draconibacterium sp.]